MAEPGVEILDRVGRRRGEVRTEFGERGTRRERGREEASELEHVCGVRRIGDAALEPLCGAPWAEWHDTNGASGIEPPADVATLWDLVDEWKSTAPDNPRYAELGRQIVEIHRAHFFLIGTVTSTPAVTIVSNNLGNVPEWKINAFEYYRMYPQRTDQWYFKTLPAGQ